MRVIGDIVVRNARMSPHKEAVVFGKTRLTFASLNEQANSMSNAFIGKMGVKKGDRIAFLSQNCHQLIVSYLATQKAGAIFVPLNFRLTFDELLFMVNDCQANTLICSGEYVGLLHLARQKCQSVNNYISIEGVPTSGVVDYDDLISSYSKTEPEMDIDEKADSVILYTSGSTGRPKGVIHTHEDHISNAINMVIDGDVEEDDVTLNFLPLLASIPEQFLPHFYVGATNVVLRGFDPEKVCEAIQNERVTAFDSVPTIIIALLDFPGIDKYDLSSLRLIMYGSAAMPVEVIKRFMERFPKVSLLQAYGLTEAGPAVTFLKPKDQLRKIGSVGKELINITLRIVDERGKDCLSGETGEIICKGKGMMKGYYNLPKETSEALKDGWLYTGDLARQDNDGYVYIVGRKKDIIKTGGLGVAPVEVEDVLYQHPLIKEAAVFGIPHPKWGEAIQGVVALKAGAVITEKEISEFCRSKLASFKCPKSIEFTKELPKGAFGKIDKKSLRDKFWAK